MKTAIRRTVYLLLLGLLAVALYFAVKPQPIAVDLAQVDQGELVVTVQEDGKTRIRERYIVSAPLSGRLLRIEMEPGDAVERGVSQLAVIRPRDPELLNSRELATAQSRVNAQEVALKRAKPALEAARAELQYAEADLARLRKLTLANATTQDDLERAQLVYRKSQEDFRAAIFAERIAEFELDLAQAALIRTTSEGDGGKEFGLTSPIDGRVLRVLQESATVVTPGTPLLEVGDPHDLEVEIDVLSSDAVKIHPGSRVILDRWGGAEPLAGTVRLVEPSAFTKISALGVEEQRVNVIVDITDPATQRPTLGDGFRVEAGVVIWEGSDVLRVPSGALFRDGDDWAVFVTDAEGNTARFRRVELGEQNNRFAEVRSGLELGESVVLHPSDKIAHGTPIVSREDD
ncbi:MAG: HlyD family efflux transporter periplasmic adaptor subunit [Planctomycetota bacterium]